MNLNNSLRKTPVAVIGFSAMFADAHNAEDFWTNIVQAKDSIIDVPESRWRIADYYDEDVTAPDKTYCKRGGFLPEIDFNPMEFGLPPNILEVTDVSQLLGLVAARDALEFAGYGKDSSKFTAPLKAKTGVLLGVGGGQKLITPLIARLQYPIWEKALRASGIAEEDIPHIVDKMKKAYVGWNENSFPGLLGNVISGRITNRFDLGGINSVVDAACAASLSAIKMSLSELVEGRCDMMLTGGVDTDNSPFMYMSFSKTPAFSKSGKISPFSEAADGMLIGEGLGMLVLKRLEDAERDGDQIYAVIKGVGTSSDGRFKSVYAPRSSGQALAMERAYEEAGYPAASVGLLEAHGTGTGAGDPTEFESMQMVFGKDNPRKQHVALGSVKSQVGHTKAAAGAAGMIKAVMALHHKVLPPTINVDQPNPKFDIENSAIYINTETRPWFTDGQPRRAGVSAFGFGGINVHIAMEEYQPEHQAAYRLHQPYRNIMLQAASPAALAKLCATTLTDLRSDQGEAKFNELCANSENIELNAKSPRVGFVAQTPAACIELLEMLNKDFPTTQETWEHPKGIFYRAQGIAKDTKVVALFSGQGSQYVGMGKEVTAAFPEMRTAFSAVDELFQTDKKTRLTQKVYPNPVFSEAARKVQAQALTKTEFAQPAIGTLSMGLYKMFTKAGFKADFTAGHSFGELTALWAGGAYDDQTFLALAKARGEAMALSNPNADAGTMLAVKAPVEKVEAELTNLPGVKIANVNSTKQVVLGGSTEAIKAATETLKEKGFSVVPLNVAAAFHTSFVEHAQVPFAKFVDQQQFKRLTTPVYANGTGKPYPKTPAAIKNALKTQILNAVLFKDQIENLYQAGGRVFVEFGPKSVLTNLTKTILRGKEHYAVALNASNKKDSDLLLRQAVIQLQVLGISLGNIDPYKLEVISTTKPTKLNVKLSGNNYVSTQTQKAYYDTINDDFQITAATKVVEKTVIKEVEKIVEVPIENFATHQNSEEEMMNKEYLEILKSTLEHFKSQQTKSLEIFERFLKDQNDQSQSLLQLLQGQVDTPSSKTILSNTSVKNNSNGNGSANGSTNGISKTTAKPQVKLTPTAPAVSTTTAPVATAPTPASNGLNRTKLENILMTVISEKTGYPTEMLELEMDMEADLGIDSIKRVEIFGSMTEQHPEVSGINPQELTELRTLGQIVDYLVGQTGAATTSSTTTTQTTSTAPAVVTPAVPASTTSAVDTAKLESILMAVISEKTGYPTEMLELEMDMEADLGIDSIKRVEIFGSMTEQHPEVSGINPQELTELRTLGQIVDYLAEKSGATTTATVTATTSASAAPAKPTAPATGGVDTAKFEEILLAVISEKTGYPTEMLELEMDMEADLGIDSIKRVEIFGSMTEQHPEVSGINPQELTELRTLGEIVDYLVATGKKKQ
ncbi:MAG: beta-ketoacyl synthase N-terminal-like domain-containing protein [Saprospiraceae bacterium]